MGEQRVRKDLPLQIKIALCNGSAPLRVGAVSRVHGNDGMLLVTTIESSRYIVQPWRHHRTHVILDARLRLSSRYICTEIIHECEKKVAVMSYTS